MSALVQSYMSPPPPPLPLNLVVLLFVLIDYMDDISFRKRREEKTGDTHISAPGQWYVYPFCERHKFRWYHISLGICARGYTFTVIPDQDQRSEIFWIMVDQMNRWILVQNGFIDHWSWSGSSPRNTKGKTEKVSKGLSVRKFTQICKWLRTDAFKLHIYICNI